MAGLAAAGMLFSGVYVWRLSCEARDRFSALKWELPARIYARPAELYPGMALMASELESELAAARYRKLERIDGAGSYSRLGESLTLHTRPFVFEDGFRKARQIRIRIRHGRVDRIWNIHTGEDIPLARLDPALIGSFYPTHGQDRMWGPLETLPPVLIQTVLAVEDRDFYDHHGVRPMAVLRAMIANLRAGRMLQGGSTLTQQLVKNLFLTGERSLKRKFDEAVMALSLEWYFEKKQILEAYMNEVYMGQDGKRAIHGFQTASRFYFGRIPDDLRPHETALLAGLLKGPSHFNPRRHPDRAFQRRNLVLGVMKNRGLLKPGEWKQAATAPLGILETPPSGNSSHPAFLDLVKRNLLEEYEEADLQNEGLRIFTSFDPLVQSALEKAADQQLSRIESARIKAGESEAPGTANADGSRPAPLETAAVVTDTGNNEILALMGGRHPRQEGFNRALDARRAIGSLIKPAVYLTALSRPETYHLATVIQDTPYRYTDPDSPSGDWRPRNYDRTFHGPVLLYQALAHSYNVPAVRLGMELGVETVLDTVRKLGVDREFTPYPSVLLGAVDMSVLEVAQMYQTLASGGFFTPIRAIRGVYRTDGTALSRYPVTVRERAAAGPVYVLSRALQAVCMEGTARRLKTRLPGMVPAGKTGTTDELRDSWFAGFAGNRLAAVWVGRDDNSPTGLTGSSGALPVWADLMEAIGAAPLSPSEPDGVHWRATDPRTGAETTPDCPGAVLLPFVEPLPLRPFISCLSRSGAGARDESFFHWLKDLF